MTNSIMAITKDKLLLGFLLLLISEFVESGIFSDVLNKVDSCEETCEKTYPTPNLSNIKHSLVCYYGCRSFNLVHFVSGDVDSRDVNATKEACEASCMEAYSSTQDRYACNIGCGTMAKLIQADMVVAQISWSVYVEDGNSVLVVQPGDFEPDDVLTDPGLRLQLERDLGRGIVGDDDDRLPETHVRTLPVDDERAAAADERDRLLGVGRQPYLRDWFDCASRKTGVPRLVLFGVFVVAVLLGLWFCLLPAPEQRQPVVEYVPGGGGITEPLDLPPKYSLHVEEV